jgi:asparagine synthase (glutamine-hydrolysing)
MAFVFSGRLHYSKDLARALGLEASRIATMADGEIAFAAWRTWGKTALHRLEGEFSLIFSNGATGKLVAARSPFGAPPLVYHETNRTFAIASAPRGLRPWTSSHLAWRLPPRLRPRACHWQGASSGRC